MNKRDKRCPLRKPGNRVDANDFFRSVNQDICGSIKRKFFLKHSRGCELLFLNKEFSPQCAIQEVLMPRPLVYSKNIDVKIKRKCIDPDYQNWPHPSICDIEDDNDFIVEFCVIYPEDKVSTVTVFCAICGSVVETVLDKSTTVIVKKTLMELTMSLNIESDDPQGFQGVIPLPYDIIHNKPREMTFFEGFVGYTPLTNATPFKPSVFMRVRIKFVTNSKVNVARSIHESQEEEELYPDYSENIC